MVEQRVEVTQPTKDVIRPDFRARLGSLRRDEYCDRTGRGCRPDVCRAVSDHDHPSGINAEPCRRLDHQSIQAAGLSGAGLGDIDPGVACLQIPMMFDSYEELDYVRDRVAPKLEQRLRQKGYEVLYWSDVG